MKIIKNSSFNVQKESESKVSHARSFMLCLRLLWVTEVENSQSLKYFFSGPFREQFVLVHPCSRSKIQAIFRMLTEIESSYLTLNDHFMRPF